MSDCVVKSQIFKYSSSKMLTLLEVLRRAMPKESVNVVCDACDAEELNEESLSHMLTCVKKKTKFCTLVFVERRFTAKIVNLVLKVTMLLSGLHNCTRLPCLHDSCNFLNQLYNLSLSPSSAFILGVFCVHSILWFASTLSRYLTLSLLSVCDIT
jgi:hypothetical protein